MTKQKHRKPPRHACSAQSRDPVICRPPCRSAPDIPVTRSDDMRDVILAAYCTQLQDAARKQRQYPADRVVIPDDELPF